MTLKERLREQLKSILKFSKTNPELFIGFFFGFVLIVSLAVMQFMRVVKGTQDLTNNPAQMEEVTVIKELPKSAEDVDLPVVYQVQSGDSGWRIAEAFYGCGSAYKEIEKANGLLAGSYLEVGQQLTIPELASSSCPEPHLSGSALQKPDVLSNSGEKLVENNIYMVVEGDCLWSIALEQTSSPYNWVQIYQANKAVIGSNPDLIYPQTNLVIPQSLY